jgi:transcriptional regulator with XRE-family HTH domain
MTARELRQIREAHGLTQRAMGELLGYTPNYISRLERGDEAITQRFEKLVRSIVMQKKIKKSPSPY